MKTLKCLLTVLHWNTPAPTNTAKGRTASSNAWTSTRAPSLGTGGAEGRIPVKTLNALAAFLQAGLQTTDDLKKVPSKWPFPLRHVECHLITKRTNAYAHLNLFGTVRDEEGAMYSEREARQRIFHRLLFSTVKNNVEVAKREGGEIGRAAAGVGKTLVEGMEGFDSEI